MPYSDDPVADFHHHDAKQNRQLAERPVCCECGQPIQSDFAYEYNGEPMCAECLNTYHLKSIDYFM